MLFEIDCKFYRKNARLGLEISSFCEKGLASNVFNFKFGVRDSNDRKNLQGNGG